MLKGKAKEDFEMWYALINLTGDTFDYPHVSLFYQLPKSMQHGLYIDWFGDVGLFVDVSTEYEFTRDVIVLGNGKELNPHYIPDKWWVEIHNEQESLAMEGGYNSRQEARTKAIEKACEIYNENFLVAT